MNNLGKTIDFWKITLEEPTEAWVKEAFEKKIVFWNTLPNGHIKFLSMGANSLSWIMGLVDDYLMFDGDNYFFVSHKKCQKKYKENLG